MEKTATMRFFAQLNNPFRRGKHIYIDLK